MLELSPGLVQPMTTVESRQESEPPPTAPSSTRSTQVTVNSVFSLKGWLALPGLPVMNMARVPSNASSACPFIVVAATVGMESPIPLKVVMAPAFWNVHVPLPPRLALKSMRPS